MLKEIIEEKENFKVVDLKTAEHCMKKIKVVQSKIEEVKQYVKEEKANLDEYLKETLEPFKSEIEAYTEFLKGYLIERQKEDKKFKLKTPSGSLTTRKTPKGYNYFEGNMLKFLKENNPEFVKVETIEKFNKNDVKKKLKKTDFLDTETGEIVSKIVLNGKVVDFVEEKEVTVKYEVKTNA